MTLIYCDTREDKLSLALKEAITLNQRAAKDLESGEEVFLKEKRERLESINNDIAAAAYVTDMAELESDVAIKEKLEDQAVFMLSVASEEIRNVLSKSDLFYEFAELKTFGEIK